MALAGAQEALKDANQVYSSELDPGTWPRIAQAMRDAARWLEQAGDPLADAAWLGVAQATRYQPGHRDDTLAAYIEALFYDRDNISAWTELAEYASFAPHVPTLTGLFTHAPPAVRPELLGCLLAISYGQDRNGRMSPVTGTRLRAALLNVAESQDDNATVAVLAIDAARRADKNGDTGTAVQWWRRAVAAGSTDGKAADRLISWLIGQGEYAEAARVLRQALRVPPSAITTRERLQKRLTRCERALTR